MSYTKKELLIVWLDSFENIDYKRKVELFKAIGELADVKSFLEKEKPSIVRSLGDAGYAALLNAANNDYVLSVLESINKAGERAITVASDDYPDILRETNLPPLVLYAKGNVELLKTEMFGIVGSRKSIPLSLTAAKEFTEEICAAGFTAVTGTAEGVDSEVLKAGLNSGKIIAVSASGLNCVYPSSNKSLLDKVADAGLVISEHRENVQAKPYFFPIRNRIIAGLSQGVLAVSGRIKSGVMHTAAYCIDYGRDLFAVPYSVGIESGTGTNYLIKNGANLADSAKDILSFYGKESENGAEEEYSPQETEIISALKEKPLHIEKIAEDLGKQVFEITPTLTVLEIKGVIYKEDVNTYGLARNSEA